MCSYGTGDWNYLERFGALETRCRDHESFDYQCEICQFLRHAEQKLASLRSGRGRTFSELKQRLAKRELIMIDLR